MLDSRMVRRLDLCTLTSDSAAEVSYCYTVGRTGAETLLPEDWIKAN
jgi:hypothetical protein